MKAIMFRGSKLHESGAASLIVVLFMSIVLTIVTIGFLRVALNEQRVATDDNLSARAYYAAESGVEDAKRAIRQNLEGTLDDVDLRADDCQEPNGFDPVLSDSAEFDTEYTCMTINYTPDVLQAEFGSANQTRQYEINAVNSSGASQTARTMVLRWHIDDPASSDGDGVVDDGSGPLQTRLAGDHTIVPLSEWTHPSMMQVMFIGYSNSGTFSRGDISSSTAFLAPTRAPVVPINPFQPGGGGSLSPNPSFNGDILDASCTDANDGSYACEMEFDFSGLPASQQLEIRITNLYAPTNFEIAIWSGVARGGNVLQFSDMQAVIDVTGRSGAVYRRVEAVVDLTSPELTPEFVIQSAEDICKDFSFTDQVAEFRGVDGTSCTY